MKYIVMGLGVSGNGAINLLKKNNLEHIVVDDKSGIKSSEAINYTDNDDVVIKSPGISFENPYLLECKKRNIKIISEIDFAYMYVNKQTKIIAITGTNGKSTVVSKAYELLKYANKKVNLGGNIGYSFSDIIAKRNDYEYLVLELSSYQLENNPSIKPYISLITNLTPDHLSRYKDETDYYLTKFNIFKNQDENDYAIINKDDKKFSELNREIKAKKVYIENRKDALYFNDEFIISKEELNLKGEHNVLNMLDVIAIAKIIGIDTKTIYEFLKEVKPLEHRIENFFTYKNTHFINDSKGTNVESSLVALDTYMNKKVFLICGGQDKHIDNEKLYQKIYEVKAIPIIIGENKNLYINEFNEKKYMYIVSDTIEKAILFIKNNLNLEKEQYILLSPATASFDQFSSFEHRGKVFKELVMENFGGNSDKRN